MDKLERYRHLIKQILTHYVEIVSLQTTPGVEHILSFDSERDQYLWLKVGWSEGLRVHGVTLHVRLHENKIWIEQDWTEDGLASDLLAAGVPEQEIIIGFHEPEMRCYTQFAVA